MSLIVHAGSAQFTTLGMWEAAGAIPIILTTLMINARCVCISRQSSYLQKIEL